VPSYLIDDASCLEPAWLQDAGRVGVTAGASAPEQLVQELIARLGDFGEITVEELRGAEEHMQFKLPRELAPATADV
jgi:4-hydroxy-3-methylbut-2-enyl diphosphate reductase